MHWRHVVNEVRSPKYYSVHDCWRYADPYFNDYYVPEAPVTLKTYGICRRAPDEHIINRYTERYMLHYILTGKGWCNGIPFEEGDIVYCTNSFPYNLSSNRSDPCTYAYVTFLGGKSEKYLNQLEPTQPFRCYRASHFQKTVEILLDMTEVDHNDVETALYLEGCFLHLLALSAPPAPDPEDRHTLRKDKRVNAAIQYISEHFRDPDIRLEDVAEAAMSNEKYLQRLFRAETGMSMYQYISKCRMDAAVTLLNSSNYNINEISEYVGYTNRQAFSKAFKSMYGVSPSRFSGGEESPDTRKEPTET